MKTSDKKLLRIVAPHFVAGIEVGGKVAPILAWMVRKGWQESDIRSYCSKKSWTCEEVIT